MNSLFSRDLCAALVLSFGHFLWIGTLIAVVTAVVAKRKPTADARYRAWLAGLITMAASPFVALLVLMSLPSSVTSVEAVPSSASGISTAQQQAATTGNNGVDEDARRMGTPARPLSNDEGHKTNEGGRAGVPILQGDPATNGLTEPPPSATDAHQREPVWWRDYAPLVTSLYLIGVALMGLRLVIGLWGGRRLRRQANLITDRSLFDALQRQADALRMKFVPAMAYCEKVTVPTVLGILKPMILLPVSVASGLTPEQVESVLAHELAHLKRYDHLVNLMQCVIESLLFFHPAVWWVSRRIRDEREHCCDDLVVACGAVPLDYATSLLRVAELSREAERTRGYNQRRSFTAVSLFATGDRPSTLRQRIARLLGYQTELNVRAVHPWTLCCLALFCLGTIVVLTRVTWIAVAEISRDRTQKTVVVTWSAIVDESVMKEIRAINGLAIQETGAMQTPDDAKYTTLRCSAEELRTILKNHADNKLLVALQKTIRHSMPTGGWSIGPKKRFFQMIDSEVIETTVVDDPGYPLNWYADGHETRDKDSDRARLIVQGNYNFQQIGLVPVVNTNAGASSADDATAATKQQLGTIFAKAKVKFDSVMSDGDATLVVLSPPAVIRQYQELVMDDKGTRFEAKTKQAPKLHAIFVHEAVRVPVKQLDQFHKLTRVVDWVRRGSAGTKEDASRITDWRSRPSRDVFDKNAKWTHALPHGGEIQLVGLGRPSAARMIWWTPDGEPLKGVGEPVGAGDGDVHALVRISETGKPRGNKHLPAIVSSNGALDVAPHLMSGGGSQFVIVPVGVDPTTGAFAIQIGAGFGAWTAETKINSAKGSTATLGDFKIVIGTAHSSPANGPIPASTLTLFDNGAKLESDITAMAITQKGEVVEASSGQSIISQSLNRIVNLGGGSFTHPLPAADIKQFVLKSRPIQWTEFTSFATEPATPLNPPLNFPKRHIAQLPDGVSVEFVGLAAMEMNPQKWWLPDGVVLSPPPPFKPGIELVSMTGNDGPVEIRWAQIQVRGVGDDQRAVTANMTGSTTGEQLPSGEKVVSSSRGLQRAPNKKTAEVRIGVATEPISPVRVLDANGQHRQRSDSAPADPIAEDIVVTGVKHRERDQQQVGGPFVTVNQTELTYEIPTAWSVVDLRMVAIDKSGQTHQPSAIGGSLPGDANSQSKGMSKGTTSFPLPPDQIDRFEYQFRVYRHWATFENVAFNEGDMTQLKITTDSLPAAKPQHYVANLPDGRSVEFVGITKNTRPANEGWKPDGRAIGEVGYWPSTIVLHGNTTGTYTENGPHPEPNVNALDVLFRFQGLKSTPSIVFDTPTKGVSYHNWPIKEPYELRGSTEVWSQESGMKKWYPEGLWRVGLTDEPWGRYVKISPDGKVLDPIQPDDLYASSYKLVEVLGTQPHDRSPTGNVVVLREPNRSSGPPIPVAQYAFEFRAIDNDGKELRADIWQTQADADRKVQESQYGLMQSLPAGKSLSHYEFRLRPYRHWVTFNGVSVELGKETDVKVTVASLPIEQPKPKQYVANLPDGRSVEFVGITKNTRPANEGWKPDGRVLGDVGYWPSTTVLHNKNTSASYVENGPHPEPDADAVDFLFRYRGLKSQPSITHVLPTTGVSYPHLPLKEPYELRVSGRLRGEPHPGAKWSLTDGVVKIGLTDEPWGKWLQIDPAGQVLNPLTDDDSYRSSYELIQLQGVVDYERAPNKKTLLVRVPKNHNQLFALEMRAVDDAGKNQWLLEWESRGVEKTDLEEQRWGLASAEKQPLARYEFRLRPYRHWVTFEGVSVESGKETDVKVEAVEPLVKPQAVVGVRSLNAELEQYGGFSLFRLQRLPVQRTFWGSVRDLDTLVAHLPEQVQRVSDRRFNEALLSVDMISPERFESSVDRLIQETHDLPAVYRAALMFNLMMTAHHWLGTAQGHQMDIDATLFERIKNKSAMAGLMQVENVPVGLALRMLDLGTHSHLTLNTDDDPDWPAARLLKAKLWLTQLNKVRQVFDPEWDEKDVPMLNIEAPEGLPAEVSAKGIRDPQLQAEYERRLEANRRKAERYNEQIMVRRMLAELSPRMEEDLIRLYVRQPLNLAQFEKLLNQYSTDGAQRDRMAKTVRLFNEIIPGGTRLKYGWPDGLAEAGPAGVPQLIDAVRDKTYPEFIRHDGAWALGLIGDPRAIPVLNEVAEDAETPDKYKDIAREFLKGLNDKPATPIEATVP